MRKGLVVVAAFGAWLTESTSAVAAPAQSNDVATIRALEEEWERALLSGSDRVLQRILAPEFKLMVGSKRGASFTPRSEWFANLKGFKIDEFRTEVVDVVVAGNTAIATVEGSWKVSFAGRGRDNSFIISDTWVKRNGRWTVIFRHSANHPKDSPSPATR